MESHENVVLISAIFVFIVGIANIIVLIIHNKKSTFINSITQERFKYIHELRKNLSAFCLFASESSPDYKELKRLKYDIILSLCPVYEEWDGEVIKLVTKIASTNEINRDELIKELVVLNQFMLKMEWEGAQLESKKGTQSEMEKQDLRNRNFIKYEQNRQYAKEIL